MGISVSLEDEDIGLWRSLKAIKEACIVGERLCRDIGLQTSRSRRERKSKVGHKACSIVC